ncbi:nuclease-related domain-containing protein [Bacillus sp. Marseille-Q3570]|uniref:nuclease-related domain-containing protein n=1 Tax=Bacillus sp. Marseille-Q3570 TaxID=2963522 RepID=UPI0021B81760|nr:nuclease-related domain-containing protein [Bacillus sp. Marseille-Q3570]
MIMKERTEPRKIDKLEAQLRRLSYLHPQYPLIEKELAMCKAGYRGEQALDYHLEYLPEKDYYIFHDLRLFDTRYYFQIDTLIVTPYFMLIVEVKNIAGKIRFDEFNQMVRTRDGTEEGLPDPFLQLQWLSRKLAEWLKINNLPSLPIDHIVVISRSSTIVEVSEYTPEKLTLSANLPFKIEALRKTFPREVYSKKQLRKLSKLLVKKHTPQDPDVMKQFKIEPVELLTGVYCAECKTMTMERNHGRWICSNCSHICNDAKGRRYKITF